MEGSVEHVNFLPKGSQKTTEISLGDVSVKVATDTTPAIMKQIRELVEGKFNDLSKKSVGGVSTHQLTVLVAYNLAEELLKEQAKMRNLKKEIVERTERLLNRVESHLGQKT